MIRRLQDTPKHDVPAHRRFDHQVLWKTHTDGQSVPALSIFAIEKEAEGLLDGLLKVGVK